VGLRGSGLGGGDVVGAGSMGRMASFCTVDSMKGIVSCAIQTKHTVHRVHRGEGKESVQNVVLQSQLGV